MQTDQYEPQSECQDYEDYTIEGYHPVELGQKFKDGTYQVIQKLGWGHFSTVWLVYDKIKNQYSALKIQRSKESHAETAKDQLEMLLQVRKHETDPKWLQFLSQLQTKYPQKINSKLCRPLLLLDNFVHYGIHGKHLCSVFELMGPNLLDLIQHYEFDNLRMPLWLVKKITRDVLIGLVYLHQSSHIIHTDLKPQNIMIKLQAHEQIELVNQLKKYKLKPISMKYLKALQTSKNTKNKKKNQKKKLKKKLKQQKANQKQDQQQQQIAQNNQKSQQNSSSVPSLLSQKSQEQMPQIISISSSNHKQEKQQEKQQENQKEKQQDNNQQFFFWKDIKIRLNNKIFFKIADLGNACYQNKHFSQDIQTREYRSPQVILGQDYLPNADVYSLACTVFEMLTNNFLFKPKKIEGVTKDQDHMYQIIETIGQMDKSFCLQGKLSPQIFNKKGKILHNHHPKQIYPLCRRLSQKYQYDPQEAIKIQKFLLPMLAHEPLKRISARKCLQSQWLWN